MSKERRHGGHACNGNSNGLLGDARTLSVNNLEDDSTLMGGRMCVLYQRQDYYNNSLVRLSRLWYLITKPGYTRSHSSGHHVSFHLAS